MKRFGLMIPPFLLLASAFGAGAEWNMFDAGRFSILMPQPPRPTANSQWVSMDPRGRAYNASTGHLTNPPLKAKDYFDQTVEVVVEGTHGHLVYKKFLTVQGLPACEFKITDKAHLVGGRLVLDKAWVYILEFATDTHSFDTSLMNKFFDSFRLNGTEK